MISINKESLSSLLKRTAMEELNVTEEEASRFASIATTNYINKCGADIRQSEIDHFKELAISSLGKGHEISFNDAERGFLKAALADGKNGFKEFIESIPVETPVSSDGTKMINHGNEKKTS